jgi:hypothetical protein
LHIIWRGGSSLLGQILLAGGGLGVGTRRGVASLDAVFTWVGAVAFQPAICQAQESQEAAISDTHFLCLQGAHESGTRFRFRMTLNSGD